MASSSIGMVLEPSTLKEETHNKKTDVSAAVPISVSKEFRNLVYFARIYMQKGIEKIHFDVFAPRDATDSNASGDKVMLTKYIFDPTNKWIPVPEQLNLSVLVWTMVHEQYLKPIYNSLALT